MSSLRIWLFSLYFPKQMFAKSHPTFSATYIPLISLSLRWKDLYRLSWILNESGRICLLDLSRHLVWKIEEKICKLRKMTFANCSACFSPFFWLGHSPCTPLFLAARAFLPVIRASLAIHKANTARVLRGACNLGGGGGGRGHGPNIYKDIRP